MYIKTVLIRPKFRDKNKVAFKSKLVGLKLKYCQLSTKAEFRSFVS